MSTLRSELEYFWEAVTGPSLSAEDADRHFVSGRVPAAERLRVYRDMYRVRLGKTMETTLPAARAFLGEARFRRLAWQYLCEHPSQVFDIERVGEEFNLFLTAHHEPEAAELAALDTAWLWALRAPRETALRPENLATGEVEQVRRAASARLFRLHHTNPERWLSLREGGQPVPAPTSAEPISMVTFRHGFRATHLELTRAEYDALQTATEPVTVATLCETFTQEADPTATAMAAFGRWVPAGLLVAGE